jgi:hypothetical protein
MTVMAWLEAEMVHRLFKREIELLREEIRIAATWPVPANDDYENFIYEQGGETWIRAKAQRGEEHRGGVVAGDRGGQKRTRDNYEEDEGTAEFKEEEIQVMPPFPPAKRAKFEYPCVVPSCDKGYKNKASLQRHVFHDHDRVSDLVARRACRLLWGETFKGGRLGEVNMRFGEYPKGA